MTSWVADFNWREPDYVPVFQRRVDALARLRKNPQLLPGLKAFYRDNIAQFITDWGCTADPRNVEIGLPGVVPFILFPRQVEFVEWIIDSWKSRRPGVMPKSRESGASWLAIATACSICLFYDDVTIGFGSRKAELVDKLGDPDSLFWKAREFLALLPTEFNNGWSRADAPEMRIKFSASRSVMKGEGGDDIGRGGRSSLYIVDEAAFLARPQLAEASLSATTNCRIDISTANGLGNPFHTKVTTWSAERVFRLHWRDDPRKDDEWYQRQLEKLDPVTIAQEIDIDFAASVEGVLVPSAWVQAAVDAHKKLGIYPTGSRVLALDVADEGKDTNAACMAHGVVVQHLEEWSGIGDDIFGTVERAFRICDEREAEELIYDADGLGAGVRGDSRVINERREKKLAVSKFRGSESPFEPEKEDVKGRKNKDMFANLKAQAWWRLRVRFQKTFRWVQDGIACDPDEIISLSGDMKLLQKLCSELSQPTYSVNGAGKFIVDKKPDGTKSPNLADSVMIRFAENVRKPMKFTQEGLAMMRARGMRR